MRTQRPLLIVLGVLLALAGLAALAAGAGLTWAHATQRDGDGYYTSEVVPLEADGHAITTDELRVAVHPGDWVPGAEQLTFRVTATPTDGGEVFLGLADAADVADYLAGVAHSRVTHVDLVTDVVRYDERAGGATPAAPGTQDFWAVSMQGEGTQELTTEMVAGDWELVVMNADGAPGVAVDVTAGLRTPTLLPAGLGLLVLALVLLAGATALLVIGAGSGSAAGGPPDDDHGDRRDPDDHGSDPQAAPAYPLQLTGQLDPELSRGLWLVKWALALPHVIALAFLWVAFGILTVVAGVAILFTGRYPAGIFDFNVGVLRWTWRVTYYAFGVLGTDRYPPFSLAPDPDYPASLEVARPGELSRGLVLVKWWLLALPHYLVVGIFTGGLLTWTFDQDVAGGGEPVLRTGLVGVLVLVAAVVLLVRGRYPRGLFDLVMGLQRWAYRVTVYAGLMTDEYPPFRLDTGGDDGRRPAAGGDPAEPDPDPAVRGLVEA